MANNKYTKTIQQIFENNHNPICANEIIDNLKKNNITPNKTTIYRALTSLTNSGYLQQIIIDSNTSYYEKAQSHHHHFICTHCKTIEDFEPDEISEAKFISKLKGKKILFHTLEFFGLCEKCK